MPCLTHTKSLSRRSHILLRFCLREQAGEEKDNYVSSGDRFHVSLRDLSETNGLLHQGVPCTLLPGGTIPSAVLNPV
jgi:hypothetical protein